MAKHRRTISHGMITKEMAAMYSDVVAPTSEANLFRDLEPQDSKGRSSKDDIESLASEESPAALDGPEDNNSTKSSKRRSLLQKLHLGK